MKISLIKTRYLVVLLILFVLILFWYCLPYLIHRISPLLLQGYTLQITRPHLTLHGLAFRKITLSSQQCRLVTIDGLQQRSFWALDMHIDRTTLDDQCLTTLSQAKPTRPAITIHDIVNRTPNVNITSDIFTVESYPAYQGQLSFVKQPEKSQLSYRAKQMAINISFNNSNELLFHTTYWHSRKTMQEVTLTGTATLANSLMQWPISMHIDFSYQDRANNRNVTGNLAFQGVSGQLNLANQEGWSIALPMTITSDRIAIHQGNWTGYYKEQPISGTVDLTLDHWRMLTNASLIGEFRVRSKGQHGIANAVLSLKKPAQDLAITTQFTGQFNHQHLNTYFTLPGILSIDDTIPTLRFLPGARLYSKGEISPELTITEIRFPLAGIEITPKGINHRLQAILRLHHQIFGDSVLHLDGRATHFWPDQGLWQWHVWGEGDINQLKAKWHVNGIGEWRDQQITLTDLEGKIDQLIYGLTQTHSITLSLPEPLQWQRDQQHFQAQLRLASQTIKFQHAGQLTAPQFTLNLSGQSPSDFNWRGILKTTTIGPIQLNGRLNSYHLRGQAWWPKQSLTVFQSLLAPELKVQIRSGSLYAQSAFSFTPTDGFQAGGHIVIEKGELWLNEGRLEGINFTASYLLKNHRWYLGSKGPIQLTIDRYHDLFAINNLRASLQGYYPATTRYPLKLYDIYFETLGGSIALDELALPPQRRSMVTLRHIELSELFPVLKIKQVAMSGPIDGDLPLYFNDPKWLVKAGRITHPQALTLRIDPSFIDTIRQKNSLTGAVIDWLHYVEINQLRADIDINRLGDLTLSMHLAGVNPLKSDVSPINLHYVQQENIFQLWRSLTFGRHIEERVAKQLSTIGTEP